MLKAILSGKSNLQARVCEKVQGLITVQSGPVPIPDVERRLLSSSQALDNVEEIMQGLQSSHPHLSEVLKRVIIVADLTFSL